MIMFPVEPPPPPPPPIQMYRVFLPEIQTEKRDTICIAIENQYQSLCDYAHKDSDGRWYLTDEGLFDTFASQAYFTINGVLYNNISFGVVASEALPDHKNILYINLDDMYYWIDIAIIGNGEFE